jgi:hypothetical protein
MREHSVIYGAPDSSETNLRLEQKCADVFRFPVGRHFCVITEII